MKNLTFQQFLNELQSLILNNPNYDLEDETLYELRPYHFFELGLNTDTDYFEIYLNFSYTKEHKEFFDELFNNWFLLLPIVQPYFTALFSENTNDDPCSFEINWDTDHANTTEEARWELTLTVIDSLS